MCFCICVCFCFCVCEQLASERREKMLQVMEKRRICERGQREKSLAGRKETRATGQHTQPTNKPQPNQQTNQQPTHNPRTKPTHAHTHTNPARRPRTSRPFRLEGPWGTCHSASQSPPTPGNLTLRRGSCAQDEPARLKRS